MGPLTWHTVNSALIMNNDELNKFTRSFTYSIWRFIFSDMASRGRGHGTPPPKKKKNATGADS